MMRDRSSVVLLDGGLGNQLFQVAFALYLRTVRGCNTYVDFSALHKTQVHGIGGIEDIIKYFDFPVHEENSRRFFALVILAQLRRALSQRKGFLGLDAMKGVIRTGRLDVYCGYWQGHAMLVPFYLEVAKACNEIFEVKSTLPVSAVVHFRFGDYVTPKNQKIYFQADEDYYKIALDSLFQEHGIIEYSVVTNDVARAKHLLSKSAFKRFIFSYAEGSMLDDFATIARASTLVSTNSTFCWWGALTAAINGNLVNLVAPKKWFKSGFEHRECPLYETIPLSVDRVNLLGVER